MFNRFTDVARRVVREANREATDENTSCWHPPPTTA